MIFEVITEYNSERIHKGYYEGTATEIESILKMWAYRYWSQGYNADINTEIFDNWGSLWSSMWSNKEEDTNDVSVTMIRVPFMNSSVDPSTFETTINPTGMTDTIIIHCKTASY